MNLLNTIRPTLFPIRIMWVSINVIILIPPAIAIINSMNFNSSYSDWISIVSINIAFWAVFKNAGTGNTADLLCENSRMTENGEILISILTIASNKNTHFGNLYINNFTPEIITPISDISAIPDIIYRTIDKSTTELDIHAGLNYTKHDLIIQLEPKYSKIACHCKGTVSIAIDVHFNIKKKMVLNSTITFEGTLGG